MDIVFVSPEVAPFSKVGGLADVSSALPKALRTQGHKVTVVSLRYGSIDPAANALARRLTKVKVPLGDTVIDAEVHEARLHSGVQVVLLGAPGISDRQGVYGDDGVPFDDNHLRFGFLARGAVEWMRAQSWTPDIVHVHDWTTALVPVWLKLLAVEDPRLATVRSVFTLHNLAQQGLFPLETLAALGLPAEMASPSQLEFYGQASWLKGAVMHSDRFVTVSPTYAREVLSPDGGMRMDGVLRSHAAGFTGILNGIDTTTWSPATDPCLVARYDAGDTAAKRRCKADLQQRLGLPVRPETPVFGMVARLDHQKGVDILLGAAERMVRQDLQLVVQGAGDPKFTDGLRDLAKEMPDKVVYRDERDEALAHRIFAGSDFFLLPSRFEPCGLTQLYAMRYGSVPIARSTGGLRDTVIDCPASLATGSGFVFDPATPDGLYGAVSRALVAYGRGDAFGQLVRRVMRLDWSWDRSARRYVHLYESLQPRSPDDAAGEESTLSP